MMETCQVLFLSVFYLSPFLPRQEQVCLNAPMSRVEVEWLLWVIDESDIIHVCPETKIASTATVNRVSKVTECQS